MGLLSSIFGGSKSKQSSSSTQLSENQAYPALLGSLGPNIGLGNSAMSILGSMLGVGDPAAGHASLNNFLDSTGYKFLLDSGNRAITDSAASRGLWKSGATGKALVRYGQNLGSTKIGELMDKLATLGQYGLGSAASIGGAGQKSTGSSTSTGTSSSSNGIFNSLFPGGLSDKRLKNIIDKVGETIDGIGIYLFEYITYPGIVFKGVMAQEVEEKRPHAMGPVWHCDDGGNYFTVNYEQMPELPNGPVLIKESVNG